MATKADGYRRRKKFACEHPEKFEYEACGFCLATAYDLLERAVTSMEAGGKAPPPNWLEDAKEFCRPKFDYRSQTAIPGGARTPRRT